MDLFLSNHLFYIISILLSLYGLFRPRVFYLSLQILILTTLLYLDKLQIFNTPSIFWKTYLIVLILLFPSVRRYSLSLPILWITRKLKLVPSISKSEEEALFSGSSWIEGSLFSGQPNWKEISSLKLTKLSKEEKDFLDGPVQTVCEMTNNWDVIQNGDLPKEVWDYLKKEKFFGLHIPKKYGGLGFSQTTHSLVIQKLATRSYTLAITTMVPNSLGPGELILAYGTEEQKDNILPKLASGEEIPSFALTEPFAGSDATSIQSEGILFEKDGQLYIKVNWSKRYITLVTVSSLLGVAFQLKDPDQLLGNEVNIGITCALIPSSTKGVLLGRRHDPMGVPFYNGPTNGKDVIISINDVIGGVEQVGKGWKMLSESLATGRGISIPALSVATGKFYSRLLASYTQIRRQFHQPISNFEGVQEPLSEVFSMTYMMDCVNRYTLTGIDQKIKPPVVTAINKYHFTEIARTLLNHSMDILGGKALLRGPRNLTSNNYKSIPIAITVEGANILTRSLIQYGQGSLLSHPHLYPIMSAIGNNHLALFDKHFSAIFRDFFSISFSNIFIFLTRGHFISKLRFKQDSIYFRTIHWASVHFRIMSDLCFMIYGGKLKFKEMLGSKLADILSWLYLLSTTLAIYQQDGRPKNRKYHLQMIMEHGFNEIQKAFIGIYKNIKLPLLLSPIPFILRKLLEINPIGTLSTDSLKQKVVEEHLAHGESLDTLSYPIFLSEKKEDPFMQIENTFKLIKKNETLYHRFLDQVKNRDILSSTMPEQINEALEKGLIDNGEKKILEKLYKEIKESIDVDEFTVDEYLKTK